MKGAGGVLPKLSNCFLLSSELVRNIPRLQAHHLLSGLHLLMGSEPRPTALLLEAPWRARASHTPQITRQRRIKQTSKQTNPQITNCLCISGWRMGRASGPVSLVGLQSCGHCRLLSHNCRPAPLTLAISSCSSSSVCSDSGWGGELSPTTPSSGDLFLLPSGEQRRGEARLAGSQEGWGPT